jgi:hypothetical protein
MVIVAMVIILARAVPALFLMVFTSLTALAVYLIMNRILEKYHLGAV